MAMGKIGIPLTQEEFVHIKELQGKGEIIDDIIKTVDRSNGVIAVAMKTNTLEEYFEMSRDNQRRYKANREARIQEMGGKSAHNVQVTTLQPKTPYGRLRQLRDRVDEAFIDVIVSEINESKKELVQENGELKKENEELKKQLEGSSDRLINGLKHVLHPEPEMVERKTLLALYYTANKRLAYRMDDLQETLSEDEWKDFSSFIAEEHSFLDDKGLPIVPVGFVEKWMNHTLHKLETDAEKLIDDLETPTVSPTLV